MPRPDPIPPELLKGPFTLETARQAGLTRDHLVGARFRRVFHSVYVPASLPDSLTLRCDAASLLLPDAACFSHTTAASLYAAPLPRGMSGADPLHVTVPPGHGLPRAAGICGHIRVLDPEDVRVLRQRRITTPARTFTDLAETYDRIQLVVVGDALLNKGWASEAELAQAVCRSAGQRGCVLAADVLPHLEPRAGSPMESILRIGLVDGGLPRPEANMPVFDAHGQWIAQPDLLYRRERVALEYEGEHHRTDKRQYVNDTVRDRLLAEMGYVVLRFTAVHVLRDMEYIVDSVAQVLANQSARFR